MQVIERKAPRSLKEYFDGTRETMEVYGWIFRQVITSRSKVWMLRMFISMIVMIVVQTIQPGALSYVFNGAATKDGNMVIWGLGIFFAALVIQKIAQRYHDKAREWVIGLHWGRLDDVVTELFLGKSLAQHAEKSQMLAPTTIEKGKTKAIEVERTLYFDGIPTIFQLILSFVCLCFLNVIAGIVMGLVVLTYVVWSLYLNALITDVCTPLDARFRFLGRRRNERMERAERVKVCGKEDAETQEMSLAFGEIIADDRKFWLRFLDIAFVRSMVNVIGLIAIMAWGAWLVFKGELNIGLLYPLYTWATRVSENIWRIGDIEHKINWNIPAVKSMIAAVSIEPAIKDKEDAFVLDSAVSHEIVFDNVSHHYPGEGEDETSPAALTRVRFTIEPGEKVALLGGSGAGKSTAMKKLLRFGDPTDGRILVDNRDLRNITQASWKKGIGYIPQQAQVFDGTIRYNLTYALTSEERKKITDEKLWELMKLLQIDFGERLTSGLDTLVGKNGIMLSGGQAQRLMIGAAVVKKPWLLIVDEATSSLDSTTEKLVQQGLATVLAGSDTSALIVAHRLSTVRHLCTKFVVLRPANTVMDGESQVEAIASTFEELYEMSPTFRQLANDQEVTIEGVGQCA